MEDWCDVRRPELRVKEPKVRTLPLKQDSKKAFLKAGGEGFGSLAAMFMWLNGCLKLLKDCATNFFVSLETPLE